MPGTRGVLVAGGAGRRLGLGTPKALARLGGETLLDRSLATLAAVCDQVVVTAPVGLEPALALAVQGPAGRGDVRVSFRADGPRGRTGPLAGLVAGLAGSDFDRAVVLGVDLPFVRPALLEALLERLAAHDAVVPVTDGFPQPLAAVYAPAAGAILDRVFAAGERSLIRALDSLDTLRLVDEVVARLPGGPDSFFNLNTGEDLAEAERRLTAREAAG